MAGSADKEFNEDINIIIKILKNNGYKPYFAVFEEQYNENAFCTKICSKIISAEFCIVMLNNPRHNKVKDHSSDIRFPSANVYFEYGMMTAMNKNIIPIIGKKQKLPFNVQHLDVLIYETLNELSLKLTSKLNKNI